MTVGPTSSLASALTRATDATRLPSTRSTAGGPQAVEVQRANTIRSMNDAREAARAAFARVVSQPARVDTAQRLAEARQANPERPVPRGSIINMVV